MAINKRSKQESGRAGRPKKYNPVVNITKTTRGKETEAIDVDAPPTTTYLDNNCTSTSPAVVNNLLPHSPPDGSKKKM